MDPGERGAPPPVGLEFPEPAVDHEAAVHRPVTGREPPQSLPIAREARRVGDRIVPLCERGTPGVFEVVKIVRPHRAVANAPEVDPDMRVLMPEQGPETDVLLTVERAPTVAARPHAPGVVGQRM